MAGKDYLTQYSEEMALRKESHPKELSRSTSLPPPPDFPLFICVSFTFSLTAAKSPLLVDEAVSNE